MNYIMNKIVFTTKNTKTAIKRDKKSECHAIRENIIKLEINYY